MLKRFSRGQIQSRTTEESLIEGEESIVEVAKRSYLVNYLRRHDSTCSYLKMFSLPHCPYFFIELYAMQVIRIYGRNWVLKQIIIYLQEIREGVGRSIANRST